MPVAQRSPGPKPAAAPPTATADATTKRRQHLHRVRLHKRRRAIWRERHGAQAPAIVRPAPIIPSVPSSAPIRTTTSITTIRTAVRGWSLSITFDVFSYTLSRECLVSDISLSLDRYYTHRDNLLEFKSSSEINLLILFDALVQNLVFCPDTFTNLHHSSFGLM